MTITNSTLANNSAIGGNGGTALTNGGQGTNLPGDGGSGFGGAVFSNGGTITITSSTVAFNTALAGTGEVVGSSSAGGVFVHTGTVSVNSTIIGKNTAVTDSDVQGSFQDNDYNLIQNTTGGSGLTGLHDITGLNPLLQPLGNYGGATQTVALKHGSPALDNGAPSNGVVVDQRGAQRGRRGSMPASLPTSAPARPVRRIWSRATRQTLPSSAACEAASSGPTPAAIPN